MIKIETLGSHGEGVGKLDGYTLFVEGALPGETVEVEIEEKRKTWGKARLLSIVSSSPHRVKPPCPLFGTCGGCQVMHLSYEGQLEMKRQKVVDALKRIAHIDAPVNPCQASPKELHYRNKIQLPVQIENGRVRMGLYEKNSHKLVEVPRCYIHSELGEEVYKKTRGVLLKDAGELRHLLIKSALSTEEALVIFVTDKEPSPALKKAAQKLLASCPIVKGVCHNLHEGKENVILGTKTHLLAGRDHIFEELADIRFKISPLSFFQVNPAQAVQLYQTALDWANLSGKETVLDAYCGVGTLSLFFARKAKEVIGVECVPQAIANAKENALLNKINNVSFVTADAAAFIQNAKPADLVLLNPPRKGCDPTFLQGLQKLKPKALLYVSCDPATLARDLSILQGFGYRIDRVQPFDMFPQTAHVETLVRLTR